MRERKLNSANIGDIIEEYESSISQIGNALSEKNLRSVPLLEYLKRARIAEGPYPNVTFFEAANRVMTDLVILKGVQWMLKEEIFPFDEYEVEYGNENNNSHDISAQKDGKILIGEAFNVAPALFPNKRRAMRNKLNSGNPDADFKLILANSDAVKESYNPKLKEKEYLIFIDVSSGEGSLKTYLTTLGKELNLHFSDIAN